MLGSIRKFSTSIYAKVLLIIVIIPFVFWGMGSSFRGGDKNIIVEIENDKYSIQQFSEFINRSADQSVGADDVENLLSAYIGEKLIEKEIETLGIQLSKKSLSKLIKNQKEFKKDNKFSRTKYEKFLLTNNITAVNFETLLANQEKKKQLLQLISGGIIPPKFLINSSYDKMNQKRNIELINLNEVFSNDLNFSDEQVNAYFKNNVDKYSEIYRSINLLELTPKKLIGNNEFNDLFFKAIDEIDDLIINGEELDNIIKKYNLEKPKLIIISESGRDINSKTYEDITDGMVFKFFKITNSEPTIFIEAENKYYIAKLIKTEKISKNIKEAFVKKEIISDLNKKTKRELISQIISKINKNSFNKPDFDKLSKSKNVEIKKVSIENQEDNKLLKKEIISEIYKYNEKKIIVVNDLSFSESYLIYIDKIENVRISGNSDEYEKYSRLAKFGIITDLYNTYDNYLKKRYKVDINYQALETVKNYFN